MAHMCDEKNNILGLCNKRIYIWMDEEVRMFTSLNFTEWKHIKCYYLCYIQTLNVTLEESLEEYMIILFKGIEIRVDEAIFIN